MKQYKAQFELIFSKDERPLHAHDTKTMSITNKLVYNFSEFTLHHTSPPPSSSLPSPPPSLPLQSPRPNHKPTATSCQPTQLLATHHPPPSPHAYHPPPATRKHSPATHQLPPTARLPLSLRIPPAECANVGGMCETINYYIRTGSFSLPGVLNHYNGSHALTPSSAPGRLGRSQLDRFTTCSYN